MKLKLLELKKRKNKEKNLKSILKKPVEEIKKTNNEITIKKKPAKNSPQNTSVDFLMNKNKVKKDAYVFFEE